jgi:hypothetical protein
VFTAGNVLTPGTGCAAPAIVVTPGSRADADRRAPRRSAERQRPVAHATMSW